MNQFESVAILPVEYYRAVGSPEYADQDANTFLQSVIDLEDRKDQFIQQIDPNAFAIPIKTALFLYRRNPQDCRPYVLRAIGWGTNAYYFQSLAAAAHTAFHNKDYYLLGVLAYHFESSVIELNKLDSFKWSDLIDDSGHVEISDQKADSFQLMDYFRSNSTEKIVTKLESAFQRVLLRAHQHLTVRQLSRAACGYFSVVPKHFVFSPKRPKENSTDWTILNSYLREPTGVLSADETLVDEWEMISHPVLLDKLNNRDSDQKIDSKEIDENVRKLRNPFSKIANRLGAEPKKNRPLSSDEEFEIAEEERDENAESSETVSQTFDEVVKEEASDEIQEESVSSSRSWKFWQRKE